MKSLEEHDDHPDYFGYLPSLSATYLVEITNKLFRRRNDGHWERLLSLEHLVSTLIHFNSSEPRDTIYAILNLAKDAVPQTEAQIDSILTRRYRKEKTSRFPRILGWFAAQHLMALKTSKPYNVDYEQPISDIYVEFVRFCIERAQQVDSTRALDILCRPWAPSPDFPDDNENQNPHWRVKFSWKKSYNGEIEERDGNFVLQSPRVSSEGRDTIPSWIRSKDLFSYGYEHRSGEGDIKMKRKNADTLVGDPSQHFYAASGSKGVKEKLRFQAGKIEDPKATEHNHYYHSIFIKGFVLGTIAELSDRSQKGAIPKTWMGLCKRYGQTSEDPTTPFWDLPQSDDFWRTLVGDQSWKGRDTPRFYRHIIRSQYDGSDDVDLSDFSHYNGLKCDPAKDVSQRVQGVIWDRKLMVVKYKTRPPARKAPQLRVNRTLGLGPSETHSNDLICVLYGCSVPVVLREYEKSESVLESQRQQRKKELQQKAYKMFVNACFARKCTTARDRYVRRQTTESTTPTEDQGSNSSPRIRSKRKSSTKNKAGTSKRRKMNEHPAPTDGSIPRRTTQPIDQPDDDPLFVPKKFYKMIGECYVHGMMRGEAIEHQNVQKLPEVLFEIR